MNRTNLVIDSAIFLAALVAFDPRLTGIAIHEWLSLALAIVLVVHILLHWKWIIGVTRRFFQMLLHTSRLNYVLNALLFVAFVGVMLSGVLISESILPFFGIQPAHDRTWRVLHSWFADASLYLLALHFALHWKWIIGMLGRYIVAPLKRSLRIQPANAPVEIREPHSQVRS